MAHLDPLQVYDLLTHIPRGYVTTYGAIAAHLGNPRWARAVGNILHKNSDGHRYPCYKVINAQGQLSPQYAFGGMAAQKAHLEAEGIRVQRDRVDLAVYFWRP